MSPGRSRRIIFAGGGTGGHLYPALAVADELCSRDPLTEVLFIGTGNGIESRIVPESGYRLRRIISRGARGRGIAGQAVTLACLAAGIAQSVGIISKFRPDLVFGSGGYASAAAIIAAFVLRRKIVIQEQNSVPGLVNRLLSPLAKRVYLGFANAADFLRDHAGVMVTGNPLRRSIRPREGRGSRAAFGFGEEGRLLLVFGGSQGASTLNRAAVEYLLSREEIKAIIQTGSRDLEWVREKLSGVRDRVFVTDYIEDIDAAYGAADVALARAGALSVSELVAVRLPSVLVPYPFSADNHQVHNARAVVDGGGAVMILDGDLTGPSLAEALNGILEDRGRYEAMKESLISIYEGDATGAIADDIERLVPSRRRKGEGAEDAG